MILANQVCKLYIACCMLQTPAFGSDTNKIFKQDDSLNGRVCPSLERSFTKMADRIMVCSFHCSLDPSCKSLFYGRTPGTWYGCMDIYTALSTLGNESDTVYYKEQEIDVGPLLVRLSNDSGYVDRGRVEVLYKGEWGTVCDDGWVDYYKSGQELNNIKVLCGMFGYSNGTILPKNSYPMVNSTGIRTWLDNIACHGHETTIFDCDHNGYGQDNCSHDEDLSVHCHD